MILPIFLCIQGETPAKKNCRITLPNGRTIPSKRYRAWHSAALFQLESQWSEKQKDTIEREVRISCIFFIATTGEEIATTAYQAFLTLYKTPIF